MSSDDFDDLSDEDSARRAEVIRRARVEGIEAAYNSALRVCRDEKSPAQAVSNASRTLLQIGGLLDHRERAAATSTKPLHEMDGHELREALKKFAARRRLLDAADGDVFE